MLSWSLHAYRSGTIALGKLRVQGVSGERRRLRSRFFPRGCVFRGGRSSCGDSGAIPGDEASSRNLVLIPRDGTSLENAPHVPQNAVYPEGKSFSLSPTPYIRRYGPYPEGK